MENKLQQLTQKLYEEGLEKGREEAMKMVEQAKSEAGNIIRQAEAQAAKIVKDAEQKAGELTRNTHSELSLASRQSVASLKDMIEDMIELTALGKPVAELSLDAAFLKELILQVAGKWGGASGAKAELTALLPERMEKEFSSKAKGSVDSILAAGVELQYSNGVKSGFKIGPRDGSYHISFTEEDFRALLGCYLRPKVSELLYSEKEK